MRTANWYSYAAMGAVVGALALGGLPLTVSPFITQGAPISTVVASNVYYENFSIVGVGSPATYFWTPHVLVAPVHYKVVFTIKNFDSRIGTLPLANYASVAGTVGGVEKITLGANVITVHDLSVKFVSHTFTMAAGSLYVNVPIPPMLNHAPTIVSFTVIFPSTGDFGFSCMVMYNGEMPGPGMHGMLQIR